MNSRDLFARFASNWPAKILSVVAAIFLYLAYRIGSLEDRFFSVPLVISAAESYVPVGEVPHSVRITLRGASGEIFLILEDDIEAYVDLTDHQREGQYRVPVQVRKRGTAENSDIEITVEPLEVTVTLERRIVRSLDIFPAIEGFPAKGYELTKYDLAPSSIEVEGPRSAVESISNARTDKIDLTGRAEDFTLRARVVVDDPRAKIVGSDVVEFAGTIHPVVIARLFEKVPIVVRMGLPRNSMSQRDRCVSVERRLKWRI